MKNRNGIEYSFEPVDDNTYKLVGNFHYMRFGGREGVEGIYKNDLGFADPEGGPFIGLGYEIEGHPVTRIFTVSGEGTFFEVD